MVRSVSGLDNPLDILLNLDPASVFRASLFFPFWRKLDDLGHHLDIAHPLDARICDPVFVVLLIAHVLATRRPSSTMQWVQLFRTNVVSLLIRSLSSRNGLLRDTCIAQISVIMSTLQVCQHFSHRNAELIAPPKGCRYARKTPRPLYLTPTEGCFQRPSQGAIAAIAVIHNVTPCPRAAGCFLSRTFYLPSHCAIPSSTDGA